jgi:asparagine synthase (glutamine-hydrolysing)
MCGIVGGIFYKNISNETIEKMVCSIVHRGPDAKGILYLKDNIGFLGHRRLSIIDLSEAANQPMSVKRKDGSKISISYNGEIYNYKEIKKDLESLGYFFNTSSDTEVILHSFVEWGEGMLKRFKGMFSFALWDEREEKAYLVRDRFGVKPLYYFSSSFGCFFGSELKALYKAPGFEKDINKKVFAYYLKFGFIPEPFTIFKNIEKVAAGEIVIISKNKKIEKKNYWEAKKSFLPTKKISVNQAEKELFCLLKESFSYRMISDVEVGLFLSGGTDSSLIAALLQRETSKPLKTFTAGFEGAGESEDKYAQQVAKILRTEHKTFQFNSHDMARLLPVMADIFDEPFGDSSAFPLYLLAKEARKDVKVVLSGDGGDELFYGYNKYLAVQRLFSSNFLTRKLLKTSSGAINNQTASNLLKSFFGKRFSNIDAKIKKLEKLLKTNGGLVDMFSATSSYLTNEEIFKLIGEKEISVFTLSEKNLSIENQMRLWDIEQYLSGDILTKTDRATMAVGLEAREPFLDVSLLEFASSLPLEFLSQKGQQKYILKKILLNYLPKNLVNRPKAGFRPPTWQWLANDLSEYVEELLGTNYIRQQGIFNEKEIAIIRSNFNKDPKGNADLLWNIFMFQVWYKRWMFNERI